PLVVWVFFSPIRRYIRTGSVQETVPIFHLVEGVLMSPIGVHHEGEVDVLQDGKLISQAPSESRLSITLELPVRIGVEPIAVDILDLIISRTNTVFLGFFFLMALPDSLRLVVPDFVNSVADKPFIGDVVALPAIFVVVSIEMDDFVPVQLEVGGSPPGEVLPLNVGGVEGQLKPFVVHLAQVVIHVVEAKEIRQGTLYEQVGGRHLVGLQGSAQAGFEE